MSDVRFCDPVVLIVTMWCHSTCQYYTVHNMTPSFQMSYDYCYFLFLYYQPTFGVNAR